MKRAVWGIGLLWAIGLIGADIQSAKFEAIEAGVKGFVATIRSPESVVVAFDYDDTLLSPVSVLGSEAWFTWQEELLKGPAHPDRRARDFDALLTLQNRLLGLVRFRPTDDRIAKFISELQAMRVSVIVCTSRGPDEVTSTLRELNLNGIDLSGSAFAKKNAFYEPRVAYDLKRPERAGFTAVEAKSLGTPRPVAFISGVYFTEGQNKGGMLRALLHRSRIPIKALVFVDNRKKHTDRVEAFFKGRPVRLYTAHFNAVDIDSKPLSEFPEKVDASRVEWERLRGFIE